MPPKAPALTSEELQERFKNTSISSRNIRALVRNECFSECEFRNDQIIFVKFFLENNCYVSANNKTLSLVFDMRESNIRKVLCKARKKNRKIGRPLSLTEDQENMIIEEIVSKRTTFDFLTPNQILSFTEENTGKTITRGWLNSFIFRHSDVIANTYLNPQDSLRLTVPRKYLTEYLDLVEKVIIIAPAALIYNIDETGLSDWEDKKSKSVIVPRELLNTDLQYPIDRTNKHVTLVVTISADGDAYFPLAISSNENLRGIFDLNIRENVDLLLEISNSSYINKDIFKRHIINNFIPQVEEDRKYTKIKDCPSILFFDNCSSHIDDELLQILAEHFILVISYPSHTSNLFQVLDILIFGVLKIHKKQIRKSDKISPLIDHLYRIFRAYEMSTCSTTIRCAFEKAGFEYYKKNKLNYLKLNRQKIENSPSFQELWEINYPEEKLSTRRKNSKRGWLNEQFFSQEFKKKYHI